MPAAVVFGEIAAVIGSEQKRQFDDEGYLFVPSLLRPDVDIEAFRDVYIAYLDRLGEIVLAATLPKLRPKYRSSTFAERFAMQVGATGGSLLGHLDPSLAVYSDKFEPRSDWPSAQRPELFSLARKERLLDALEGLLGPEIEASPVYHLNLKLALRHKKLLEDTAAAAHRENPGGPMFHFHVGKTEWHSDAASGNRDAWGSRIVNAWIPITPATIETGCLKVAPGSHRMEPRRGPFAAEVAERAVALPAAPGDVVFMDNNILHSSTLNKSENDIRWAFNFRYHPPGQPSGRPFLPGFVARSRTKPWRELRDPDLWSAMWRSALELVASSGAPANPQSLSLSAAIAMTDLWRARITDHTDWLRLAPGLPTHQPNEPAPQR